MIQSSQFFQWMVEHHVNTNLPKCLPYLERERMEDMEGAHRHRENKHYDGVVVVADGEGLIERMVEEGNAWGVREGRTSIQNAEDLSNYLSGLSNPDGGHIYDSSRRVITGVRKLRDPRNLPEGFDPYNLEMLSRLLPKDFFSGDGSIPLTEIGTRGLVAVEMPLVYPQAHVFEVKQTRYGELGIGKVIHVDKNGLAEEFFFIPRGSELKDTLDPINAIQGIYRKYARRGGRIVKVEEEARNIHPAYEPVPALRQ